MSKEKQIEENGEEILYGGPREGGKRHAEKLREERRREMSEKKQIEEMADVYYKARLKARDTLGSMNEGEEMWYSKAYYEAGYRKQSEGEWETIPDYQPNKLTAYRHICSECKTFYKDIRPHGHKYCHECGAKMKGGEE